MFYKTYLTVNIYTKIYTTGKKENHSHFGSILEDIPDYHNWNMLCHELSIIIILPTMPEI